MQGGEAQGVRLRDGTVVKAREAVVSNSTLWNLAKMVPESQRPSEWRDMLASSASLPPLRSFMHLHLGFDASGMDPSTQVRTRCLAESVGPGYGRLAR